MRISDWSSDVCSSDLQACHSNTPAGRGHPVSEISYPVEELAGVSLRRSATASRRSVTGKFHQRAYLDAKRLELRAAAEIGQVDDETGRDDLRSLLAQRSEARRVGQGCVSTGRSQWLR